MSLSSFEAGISRARAETAEKRGRDVTIDLKIIRHGQRDPQGNLTDYGREETLGIAKVRGGLKGKHDAVKAIGSTAGPVGRDSMQRSLETAHIYAQEAGKDTQRKTRPAAVLSYEKLVNKAPYNHSEIYNAALPKNYESLSDREKVGANQKANNVAVNHIFSLDTPEAQKYKREVAASYAYVLDHYIQISQRLNSHSKVMMIAGGHGGLMEFLLHYALVRKVGGKDVRGFTSITDIGGSFDPSESYDIRIHRDAQGKLDRLSLTLDDPKRPRGEMSIDLETVKELAAHYGKLHPKARVIGKMEDAPKKEEASGEANKSDAKTPVEKKAA